MLKPDYTAAFQRDIKKLKRKHTDLRPLKEVIRLVLEDTADSKEVLRRRHRAHTLTGDLTAYWNATSAMPATGYFYGFAMMVPPCSCEPAAMTNCLGK